MEQEAQRHCVCAAKVAAALGIRGPPHLYSRSDQVMPAFSDEALNGATGRSSDSAQPGGTTIRSSGTGRYRYPFRTLNVSRIITSHAVPSALWLTVAVALVDDSKES